MFQNATALRRPLSGDLVLKSVTSLAQVERLADFNAAIHGPPVAPMTRELILHHPASHPDYWLFVEDEARGLIVSSVCLIPWTWRLDGVTLRAGEMGIVGTHADYRRQGLIRALNERFQELLDEGEFDLSQIQGIPYYYRQFGYEYALPLEGGWEIELRQIPDAPPGPRCTFRLATVEDVPTLSRLYDEMLTDLDLVALRDEEMWRYLLLRMPLTETAGEFWLVEDAAGAPIGYFVVQKYGFGKGLNVNEASRLPHPVAMVVLAHLKALAAERDKPYVRLAMGDESALIAAARGWGAHGGRRYAWQIYVPDPIRLMRTLAPVFEARVASSPFAGLRQTLVLSLYKQMIALRFEDGRVRSVGAASANEDSDLRLPPNLLAPLALGWRTREQLMDCYPDVSIWGQAQPLVDVLFPPRKAFLYTIY